MLGHPVVGVLPPPLELLDSGCLELLDTVFEDEDAGALLDEDFALAGQAMLFSLLMENITRFS